MPDRNQKFSILGNQSGFILVLSMLILVILVLIGISTTKNSQVDLQIVGNDKLNKQNFYRAESGTEVGSRMVEENLGCANGFTTNVPASTADTPSILAGSAIINGQIVVERTSSVDLTPRDFAKTETSPTTVSDAARDLYYPRNYGTGAHTNVIAGGPTTYTTGSAIQFASGYEGKGKGAAAGGGVINYTIISQGVGTQNSLSEVEILWLHAIGLEGDCNY